MSRVQRRQRILWLRPVALACALFRYSFFEQALFAHSLFEQALFPRALLGQPGVGINLRATAPDDQSNSTAKQRGDAVDGKGSLDLPRSARVILIPQLS